jgi:hypothetical protein
LHGLGGPVPFRGPVLTARLSRLPPPWAIDWRDIDLATGLIRVERSWDDREGVIGLKTAAGSRKVPIAAVLRDHLDEHRLRSGGEGLVFGQGPKPFNPHAVVKRADDAWEAAGLERITPHECRHSFASLMIAAGVNAKALSTYMGHANISITLDRYGHLMPGNEEEAAGLLDAYLARCGRPNRRRGGLPRDRLAAAEEEGAARSRHRPGSDRADATASHPSAPVKRDRS